MNRGPPPGYPQSMGRGYAPGMGGPMPQPMGGVGQPMGMQTGPPIVAANIQGGRPGGVMPNAPGQPPAGRPGAPPGQAPRPGQGGQPQTTGDSRILTKQKLQDLVAQIDPTQRLDTDAEDILMLIAEEFVESVTDFSCKLAKHRRSSVLEVKDVKLYLEKNWNIKVPGFESPDDRAAAAANRHTMSSSTVTRTNAVRNDRAARNR